MNANELADKLLEDLKEIDLFNVDSDMYGNRQHYIEQLESMLRQQQAEIEALKTRIERMIEKQSHYESMAHAGGFEAGRELGMKQERALWELAASTQEIENERK